MSFFDRHAFKIQSGKHTRTPCLFFFLNHAVSGHVDLTSLAVHRVGETVLSFRVAGFVWLFSVGVTSFTRTHH